MSSFEDWFLKVIGIVDRKMSITIDVFDSVDWVTAYRLGMTPVAAVKYKYGLN